MQKHSVVVFSCRSCQTILAWGPQTIYLFEGGVRGIIGGNRGCRGKRGKKGIPCYQRIPFVSTGTIRIAWYAIVAVILCFSLTFPCDWPNSRWHPPIWLLSSLERRVRACLSHFLIDPITFTSDPEKPFSTLLHRSDCVVWFWICHQHQRRAV